MNRRRFTRPAVLLAFAGIILLVIPEIALACPVCYGEPDSAMTKGMNNGILVLLGIVGFVQLGFVALFWSFWRRAKQIRARREQFHLIEGGL
ncbi:MAG TPA: hypothetical protein VMT00_03890 [Thermoanaerobaculia bacterium]|nr:hypothetical protein [Thermoanaerobaculia bacterium]